MALELAPQGFLVNAIAPGLTRTPPTRGRIDSAEGQTAIRENIPLRRVATPREIGRLAVYLASSDGDYITGQSITIDGGLEMNWAGRLIWPSTVRPSLRNIDFQAGVS